MGLRERSLDIEKNSKSTNSLYPFEISLLFFLLYYVS